MQTPYVENSFLSPRMKGRLLTYLIKALEYALASLIRRKQIMDAELLGAGQVPVMQPGIPTTATGFAPQPTGPPPIIRDRRVPMRERVLSKMSGKPVVTNYYS